MRPEDSTPFVQPFPLTGSIRAGPRNDTPTVAPRDPPLIPIPGESTRSTPRPWRVKEELWKQTLHVLLTQKLSPGGFEKLVQRVLRELGFTQVEVTGRTGDGGIDGRGIANSRSHELPH
jgi:hypothetical protein